MSDSMRFIWDTDMTGELGLKGNELLVYSVVNSFSQGRKGCFYGSLADLAEIVGCSSASSDRSLRSLVERGLIDKTDMYIEGVKRCAYSITQNDKATLSKCKRGFTQNDKGSLINMTNTYNKDNNKINNTTKVVSARARFDLAKALLDAGVSEQHVAEWMDIRKAKKAVNTDTAFNLLEHEAEACGISIDRAVTICIEESWKGFRKLYYDSLMARQQKQVKASAQELDIDRIREISARLRGGNKTC